MNYGWSAVLNLVRRHAYSTAVGAVDSEAEGRIQRRRTLAARLGELESSITMKAQNALRSVTLIGSFQMGGLKI